MFKDLSKMDNSELKNLISELLKNAFYNCTECVVKEMPIKDDKGFLESFSCCRCNEEVIMIDEAYYCNNCKAIRDFGNIERIKDNKGNINHFCKKCGENCYTASEIYAEFYNPEKKCNSCQKADICTKSKQDSSYCFEHEETLK